MLSLRESKKETLKWIFTILIAEKLLLEQLPKNKSRASIKKLNMKSLLFILLLIPMCITAQLDVTYDPNTNTVSVDYSGCDPCLLGSQQAAQQCENYHECNEECKNEEYEECYLDCYNEIGSWEQRWCEDDCSKRYGYSGWNDYQNCFRNCGDELEPTREIIGFAYRVIAAWDVIPFNPISNASEWKEFQSETIESNQVNIPDWNPPSPWPGIHKGNNTCYGIGIRIFYEEPDGSRGFCDFTEWFCNIIG